MGMFDIFAIKCPHCEKIHEEQTKSGECMLSTYSPGDSDVMDLLMVDDYVCKHCDERFEVVLVNKPTIEIRKK